MKKYVGVVEIFIQAGEFFFAGKDTRLNTLLGSCIAITMWHPQKLVGGMCHYMLPSRLKNSQPAQPDGKYADEVIPMFLREIKKLGTKPADYQVKIFGASNMFPSVGGSEGDGPAQSVGQRNITIARELLHQYGFTVVAEDVGGVKYRRIIFDIWSGDVWVKSG